MCVCSLSYPTYKAHAPYYIVACGFAALQYIFPTLSHKRHDFETKFFWTQNECFDFLYNCCYNTFSFQEEMSDTESKVYIGIHIKYPLIFLYICTVHSVVYLITHTNKCTYIVFKNLKFTLKHLKRSYMFRSYDHPLGTSLFHAKVTFQTVNSARNKVCSLRMIVWSKYVGAF